MMSQDQKPQRYRVLASAGKYDAQITKSKGLRRFSRWLEARAIEHALQDISGKSVLGCRCGTDRTDGLLRGKSRKVVGLDSSQAMLVVSVASLRANS